MIKTLPIQAKKYFWGDNLDQLNWTQHHRYITQTLLDKGDSASVAWLLKKLSRKQLLSLLPSLKLSPKAKNFWQMYLS